MKLNALIRVVVGCALALALTACTDDAGQQPMIIAATDMQVEPAESPAHDSSVTDTIAPATAPETAATADEPAIDLASPSEEVTEPAPEEASTAAAAEAISTVEVAAPPAETVVAESIAAPVDDEIVTDEAASAEPTAAPLDVAEAPLEEVGVSDAARSVSAPDEEPGSRPAVTVALAPATPSTFVDSYRLAARFKIVSTAADGFVQDTEITAEGAWKRAENAFGYDASFQLKSVDNGAAQTLEYVMLGDYVALRSGDGWTTSPRGEELPIREPVAMLDVPFVGALSLGAQVGEEEMAGVPTVHYRVDNAEEFGALVADAFGGRAGTLTAITLDSWLAHDGYVVKYLLAATTAGATAQGGDGADHTVDQTIDVHYAMNDIGGVGEIAWPAEAPPAAALIVPGFDPDAFPLPEDAALQPSVGSLLFTTALDELALRDFYAEQLGALGWSLDGEYGYYTARREELALVVAVTAGEEGQPTRVEVFGEPRE